MPNIQKSEPDIPMRGATSYKISESLKQTILATAEQTVNEVTRIVEERTTETFNRAMRVTQENSESMGKAALHLEENIRKRMKVLEERMDLLEKKTIAYMEQKMATQLVIRMEVLEASVQKALDNGSLHDGAVVEIVQQDGMSRNSEKTFCVNRSLSSSSGSAIFRSSSPASFLTGPLRIVQRRPSPRFRSLNTDLLKVAKSGGIEEVKTLLLAGADIESVDSTRRTPLHWASSRGDADMVALLLQCGANHKARSCAGRTPLHYAALGDKSGHCIELLAGAGCDVNCKNKRQSTPLHSAAWRGNVNAVRALLSAGADKTILDDLGDTPLDVAVEDVIRDCLTAGSPSLSSPSSKGNKKATDQHKPVKRAVRKKKTQPSHVIPSER